MYCVCAALSCEMTPLVQGSTICLCFLVFFSLPSYASTFLTVPDAFPSILHLIYGKIPPIRKGTDSRLGVGFRLGDHADFQVVFELGPQLRINAIENSHEMQNERNFVFNSQRNLKSAINANHLNSEKHGNFKKSEYESNVNSSRSQDFNKEMQNLLENDWILRWRRILNVANTENECRGCVETELKSRI